MVLNSLSFCSSVKLLISPLNLNEILARIIILVVFFFPFITLNMSCYSLLACRVSVERAVVSLMEIPLNLICCFPLAVFNVCSLCLIFVSLINVCLDVFLLEFILYVTLWASWTWVAIFFSILGKFSIIISSNIFSCPFLSSSSARTPMI